MRTAAEAGRRDRAKLKTAEILAPVPALRQGIWAQADLLKRLRDEVRGLGGPLAEAKARLEVAGLRRGWAEDDAENWDVLFNSIDSYGGILGKRLVRLYQVTG